MTSDKQAFCHTWTLSDCRKVPQTAPAAHQERALLALHEWFQRKDKSGGILVLPTGGGKTFTAARFLCTGPLSEGYKVLWLAHTHHLLEQAFHTFSHQMVGTIREPRRQLRLRVVSGVPGHYPPRDIQPEDDILVGTLQTITNAHRQDLDALGAFLRAAGNKLIVVFDEAHHAPAPSYRRLLQALKAPVLGLTATPTHTDPAKQGWLRELFPQGIIHQTRATDLMAAGVLARPHSITYETAFTPQFDDSDYEKWRCTYGDVPDDIIDQLAKSAERNKLIAKCYADQRVKFGKTLMFTDRWFQCEAIQGALEKLGVRAGSVYSHVDANPGSVEARQRRTRDENSRVLDQFRKGQLDVLLNVRMLTEGTDIPDAQTVFLTRQTTSRILLTQMVGRALRGPLFHGTADAYIVAFTDDWRQQIQWADWSLEDGGLEGETRRSVRPPVQLLSIDLIRRLSTRMLGRVSVSAVPFRALLPVGWYRTQFDARTEQDSVEEQDALVMVYEDEREGFNGLIRRLQAKVPAALSNEDATLAQHQEQVDAWHGEFLADARRYRTDLQIAIFNIARHIAQRGSAPMFFPFEARDDHDLDLVAQQVLSLNRLAGEEMARGEYARTDRFWRTLFHQYDNFMEFVDQRVRYTLAQQRGQGPPPLVTPETAPPPSANEPDEQVKEQVKKRDGGRCLACGQVRSLQVDHIIPVSTGGTNDLGNLQTLCKACNQRKRTTTMRFTMHRTLMTASPPMLPEIPTPDDDNAASPEHWERFLRATLNFFYQCGAVSDVIIGGRGDGYYHWKISLMNENPFAWLAAHLPRLMARIQEVREAGRRPRVRSIVVTTPGQRPLRVVQPVALLPNNPFPKRSSSDKLSYPVFEILRKAKTPSWGDDDVDRLVHAYVSKNYEEEVAGALNKLVQNIRRDFFSNGTLRYEAPRIES